MQHKYFHEKIWHKTRYHVHSCIEETQSEPLESLMTWGVLSGLGYSHFLCPYRG